MLKFTWCTGAKWVVGASALLLLGVMSLGCSESSNHLPGSSGSGSIAPPSLAPPQGPFPRGQADPATLPDPATIGPVISILSPARGLQQTGPEVTVVARVEDPDGVSAVSIAGAPAVASGSDYSAQVAVAAGVNLLSVEAIDGLGNRTTSYVSVTQGTFAPHDRMLTRTVAAGLTQPGLDRVADIAADLTRNVDLYPLVAASNPILKNFALKVEATALRSAPPAFAVRGRPAGVEVTVAIDNVGLDADIEVVGVALAQATITAQRATAVVRATVSQSAYTGTKPGKRALGLEIDSIDVTLTGFQLVTPSAFFTSILNPFQPLLQSMVRDELEKVIVTLVHDELGKSLTGLDTPLTLSIPNPLAAGQTIDFDLLFQVDEADGFPGVGLGLQAGFQLQPTTIGLPAASRDVFTTGTQVAATIGPEPFNVRLSQDAFNALLHNVWLTGGACVDIDGTTLPAAAPVPINVNLLYPFLPPVRGLAPDPTTPVVIEASLEAAPLLMVAPGPSPFQLSAGELQITISIDYMDGGPRAELFTLRAGAQISTSLSVSGNALTFGSLVCDRLDADILREPTVDLEDQQIIDFVRALAPRLVGELQKQLPKMPLPALPMGLSLQNVRLDAEPAVVTIRGSL